MCGHQNVALGLDVGGLNVLTITRSLMIVDSISLSWPVSGLVAHLVVVTCSQMLAWLSVWQRFRVFEKSSRSWQQALCGAMELRIFRRMLGRISQLKLGSGGVHVTGRHDEKPCRQAGEDGCPAGASRADDSSAQLKSERDTGSVVEPGMDDSKDKATPQRDDGLANIDAPSDATESGALILTQGTSSPRSTKEHA